MGFHKILSEVSTKNNKNKQAEYHVIQMLFDIYLRGRGEKRGKETKDSESCEWSKNSELERCTGDWVTVPHDFEKEYPGELVVKNRRAERTKKQGLQGQHRLTDVGRKEKQTKLYSTKKELP